MELCNDQAMEIALKKLLTDRQVEILEENIDGDKDIVINFLTRKYDELPSREKISEVIESHLEF